MPEEPFMMHPLPPKFKTVRVTLGASQMDTGDFHVPFRFDGEEDMAVAADGVIAGFILPASLHDQHFAQVLGEIREHGIRLVIMSREDVAAIAAKRQAGKGETA